MTQLLGTGRARLVFVDFIAIKPATLEASRDPYSGKPFVYAVSKDRFLLYSVGSNGIDDGGNTDETFSAPDLTLERR